MIEIPYFFTLTEQERKSTIEALIFSSEEVFTIEKLLKLLNTTYEKDGKHYTIEQINENFQLNETELDIYINNINFELAENQRPFNIVSYASGYQYTTNNEYGKIISFYIKSKFKKRLTNAMLETLSIIAYKQPISKPEIEQIRGVNSKEVLNNLIDRNLIRIIGRSENLGKALLYGTTIDFLQTFGINNIDELPKLRELEEIANDNELEETREMITLKVSEEDINKLKIEGYSSELDDDILENEVNNSNTYLDNLEIENI